MPVSSFGPRPPCSTGSGETWCQMCSSTPSRTTPSKRELSAAIASSRGRIDRHTVFHVVPNWRAKPSTLDCSRRIWPIAHQHARVVSSARRPATAASVSQKDPFGQSATAHRHVRFRHTTLTGRPKHGASTRDTSRRP
jgi:hypothetical protein